MRNLEVETYYRTRLGYIYVTRMDNKFFYYKNVDCYGKLEEEDHILIRCDRVELVDYHMTCGKYEKISKEEFNRLFDIEDTDNVEKTETNANVDNHNSNNIQSKVFKIVLDVVNCTNAKEAIEDNCETIKDIERVKSYLYGLSFNSYCINDFVESMKINIKKLGFENYNMLQSFIYSNIYNVM